MPDQHNAFACVGLELLNQPLTNIVTKLLILIVGSEILQASFEHKISYLCHASVQVEEIYRFTYHSGCLIEYLGPFTYMIGRKWLIPFFRIIRFGILLQTNRRSISHISPIQEIEV